MLVEDLEKKTIISHWPVTILNGIVALIYLAIPMYMSRLVSGEEIGKYKIIFLYLSMIPSLTFCTGIESGLYYWTGLLDKAREKVRGAWSMALIQSVSFFIILIIFSPFIRTWLRWDWEQYISFAFAALTIVLSSLYESILIARKKIWSSALFSTFFNTINALAIVFAIVYFKSTVKILWVYTITMFIKIAASYYFGVKEGWIPAGLDLREAKNVLKYYLPVSSSGVFDFFVNNADRFLLSLLISPVQFASYSFGCLAIPPLQILETSVNRVIIPQLATAIEHGEKRHAAHLYRSCLEQIMLIFIPACVGLFIFSDPIIKLLFTEKYSDSAQYLKLYTFLILLTGIPYDIAARASGDGKWILKNTIRMGSFSLILCTMLAWKWGPFGALSAMIVTLIVQKYYGFNLMIKNYGWSFKELLPLNSISLYLGLAGTLGIVCLILQSFFYNGLTWFISCSIPFALIYLGTLFYFRKDLFGNIPFLHKMMSTLFSKNKYLSNQYEN
ncbi:MAG: oligosaccharide flippase family protein [Bacteriovorax sp.]|nr:oligosaccharide flippase family protein [Bacteriovorax sp.]